MPSFKAKAPDKKGMVLVGAIAGAFGVKGEVRLRAFTDKKGRRDLVRAALRRRRQDPAEAEKLARTEGRRRDS